MLAYHHQDILITTDFLYISTHYQHSELTMTAITPEVKYLGPKKLLCFGCRPSVEKNISPKIFIDTNKLSLLVKQFNWNNLGVYNSAVVMLMLDSSSLQNFWRQPPRPTPHQAHRSLLLVKWQTHEIMQ